MLAGFIRKRDQRLSRRIMLFLMTLGQMGLVAWLCMTKLERSQWAFYIVWSLLLAAVSILRVLTFRQRAKGTLLRLKDNGQLPEDFWKPHHLSETKEGLALTYGSVRTVCAPGELSSFLEEDGLIYLKAGENIFDIVPAGGFATEQKKQDFLDDLRHFCERGPSAVEKDAGAGAFSENDKNAKSILYKQDEKTFIRTQASAFRSVYMRYQFVEKVSLLKLAATVFLIAVAVMNFSAGTAVMAAALTTLLNRNHLLVLTPLLTLRVKKELGAWAEGEEIRLDAGSTGVRMRRGKEQVLVDYKEISAPEDGRYGRLYSWGRLPVIIVPPELLDTADGKAFLSAVETGRRPLRYR